MPASTEYFTKVGSPGTATSLAAPGFTAGGTSITVGSTANWPTDTAVIFAMDTVSIVSGEEVRDVGSYCEFEGVVSSGTSITSMVLKYGTSQSYPAGSTTRVYIPVASSWVAQLITGLLVSLDQDGTLKAGAVDVAAVLASNVVTTAKIADNNVTAAKLATTALTIGYAEVTSNQTSTSGSGSLLTGYTAAVTIPAGGRKVMVTVYVSKISNSLASGNFGLSLWDGTVGSGTQLQAATFSNDVGGGTSANLALPATLRFVHTPSAGAKTYNVGGFTSAGTMTAVGAATTPGFIHVEVV